MWTLIHADCRDVMANMGDETVDSVVCDPPYHLTSIVKRFEPGSAPQQYGTDGAYARAARGFMGQTWDGGDIAFDPALWAEVLRVLKPGGHVVAFSGTRTYHRMACAIEDAGFEIRDMLSWLYGSGFPKSHNMSGDREGWGTALKPACEPICFARKSLIGTVAANVAAHGVGAINIGGCRIEAEHPTNRSGAGSALYEGGLSREGGEARPVSGRWPANVCHDGSDEVLAGFPQSNGQQGDLKGQSRDRASNGIYGDLPAARNDTGSAARFYYCAKASKRDRDEGCEALAVQEVLARYGEQGQGPLAQQTPRTASEQRNIHPTVKPTDLMRWLCRLVTPPGGLVFDPFTGSGSTGKAAMLEGFRFLGAEMTAEYIPIARARIEYAAQLTNGSN